MGEDVERKKRWAEDEVFVVLGKRAYLALYVKSQEEKEGTPFLSRKGRKSIFLEQCREHEGVWQGIKVNTFSS